MTKLHSSSFEIGKGCFHLPNGKKYCRFVLGPWTTLDEGGQESYLVVNSKLKCVLNVNIFFGQLGIQTHCFHYRCQWVVVMQI